MKKENLGVPAMLLCVTAYLIAFLGSLSTFSIVSLVALTITVFAMNFDARVKKTFVQALGLCLIFSGIQFFFDALSDIFGVYVTSSNSWKDTMDSMEGAERVFSIIDKLVVIAEYAVYLILTVAVIAKADIIISAVHRAVDGFVPVKQYAGPQYGNQPYAAQPGQQFVNPQTMNGQAQQFNGQPQQFVAGQPKQFNGQPQQFAAGQPQQQPQQFGGQPQSFNNQQR